MNHDDMDKDSYLTMAVCAILILAGWFVFIWIILMLFAKALTS